MSFFGNESFIIQYPNSSPTETLTGELLRSRVESKSSVEQYKAVDSDSNTYVKKFGNRWSYKITITSPLQAELDTLDAMNGSLVSYRPHTDNADTYDCWLWYFYDDTDINRDRIRIELIRKTLESSYIVPEPIIPPSVVFLQDVYNLRNTPSASLTLDQDLDFDDDDSYDQTDTDWETKKAAWTTGVGWEAIGISEVAPVSFTGTFDGAGFAISNLFTSKSNIGYAGLFGQTDGATISNVTISNANVSALSLCGSLVCDAMNTTITNCHSSGYVSSGVGGTGGSAGGLIGYLRLNSIISKCSSSCNVNSLTYNAVGGLIGTLYQGTVSDSFATGNATGNARIAGLIGSSESYSVTNCYASGVITGVTLTGGLIGSSASSITFVSSYYDTDTSGQVDNSGKGVPKTTVQMKQEDTFVDWNFSSIWSINETVGYPQLR